MRRPSSPSKSNACAARQVGFTGAPGGRFSFLRCSRSSYPSVKRLLTITGVNVNVAAGLVAADWRHPTLLLAAEIRDLCRAQSAGAPIGSWSGAAWGYSYAELLRTIARKAGLRPVLMRMPFALWYALAGLAEILPQPWIHRRGFELHWAHNRSEKVLMRWDDEVLSFSR